MILVLTGPTGSGKSDLALSLAKRLGAAIVNADAFQVYQELNIATAKPTPEMRAEAPHFLYDFVPLTSSYSVAEYQADMRSVLGFCTANYPHTIIAGGTGLYIKAALFDYEFAESEAVDMSGYASMSDEELHATLAGFDPKSAETIHPHNRVRVLRAIEIFLSGGRRKSDIEAEQNHAPIYPALFFGLEGDREELYDRVNRRVESMFAQGLLEETIPLIERYGRDARAFRAIGVKELFPYIDGFMSLEDTKALIAKNTRNYVKRQLTWCRHQFDLNWIKGEDEILSMIEK